MRVVYFLSAMPGTGKSTFISEHGLDAHTLSLDTMRHVYAGAVTDLTGNLVLSNSREDFVFAKFMDALDSRLQLGGVLFIDNLNTDQKSIDSYMGLIAKYDYDYRVVRFELQPFEFYVERNNKRPVYKRLPLEALERNFNYFVASTFDDVTKVITPTQMLNEIFKTADDLLVDLSSYNKIHYIGDMQGSFYPLKKYFEQEGGFKKNEFYIFVGDYIDRGIENDKCLNFVRRYMEKDNCVFLPGNHEKNLYNHANGLFTDDFQPSHEFKNYTLPQLEKAGITTDIMKEIYRKLEVFNFAQFADKKIMTTHAGLATIPRYPKLLTTDEYMRGYGPYSHNIDEEFTRLNPDNNWYQIHGHRNQYKLGFDSYPKSFALEADVEYGGNLPILRVNHSGFNGVYVTNRFFNKAEVVRQEKESNMFITKASENALSDFLTSKVNYDKSGLEIIEELRSNELVKEQKFENHPNISSFNFTKNAFFDKRFDEELVIHARGLFINNVTGEIVARGFEKFFNINERGIPSATMDNFKANVKGQITIYEKENGFLGIIGYDSENSELIYASKSNIGGEFSTYLKDIAQKQFLPSELEYLKIFANKHNVNYLFEVNDSVNDPHIIKYDRQHLVLIGVVKREIKFSQLNYEALQSFAADFKDLPVKKKLAHFPTPDNFEKFYAAVSKESAFTTKRQLEGYVCEDASLNMIKIKLPYYNFWKTMRGFVEKINRSIDKDTSLDIQNLVNNHFLINDLDKPVAIEFLKHISTLSEEERKRDIISLRDEYIVNHPELVSSVNGVPRKQKHKP